MEISELKSRMARYAGGEVEVQNSSERYCYRGHIVSIELVEASGGYGPRFSVTLAWQVYTPMVGPRLPYHIERWQEIDDPDKLVYNIDVTLPFADESAPDRSTEKPPFQNIGPSPEGGDRLLMTNPYTGEVATFFPPDGSKLDVDGVDWLPDGPYSRFAQR